MITAVEGSAVSSQWAIGLLYKAALEVVTARYGKSQTLVPA